MEAFSSLMQQLRLNAQVYHNALICGDWHIENESLGQTCFHMVTQGDCRLNVPGHLQAELSQGDLVIFPRELAHSMDPLQPTDGPHEHLPYADAVHRKGMGLLCGSVTFSHSGSRFLLDALPAVFVIAAKEQSGWVSSLLEMIMAESLVPEAGSISILDRLSELLFIYALRQFLRENTEHTGVLALYGHPRLAKAVAALHSNPAHSWSLKELAECAAMSRTSFANNFKKNQRLDRNAISRLVAYATGMVSVK